MCYFSSLLDYISAMKSKLLKIALAQYSPVWLDREATLDKMYGIIERASQQQAELIVFGEAFLPGYPFWVEHTDGAKFDSDFQKEMYAHYLDQSVDIGKGNLKKLCEKAAVLNIHVLTGIIERSSDRSGHSVYCSLVLISNEGRILNIHRKLMPTHEERLVWSIGDGKGLDTFPVGPFTLGALNCWENWMPLPRVKLYGKGENLHIAIWPGSIRNTEDITRYIAKESRSFVVSVSGVFNRKDVPDSVPFYEQLIQSLPEEMANGGSCVSDPKGNFIEKPFTGEDMKVVEIDLKEVYRERQNFDPEGHYSRPEIFNNNI